MALVYKICPRPLWEEACEQGVLRGAPVDLADGFIHFSTAAQVRETAAKHFRGQSDLVLLAIDEGALGAALVYEPSRGGALFPHLYAPLPVGAVVRADPLPVTADGGHDFAGLVPEGGA